MEVVAIWIVLGIASAVIANARGLSGCLYLALGFALGPIGLVMACAMPSPNKQVVTAGAVEMEAGPKIVCPACRSLIPAAASICRYCQSKVSASKGGVSQAAQQPLEAPMLVGWKLGRCERCKQTGYVFDYGMPHGFLDVDCAKLVVRQ